MGKFRSYFFWNKLRQGLNRLFKAENGLKEGNILKPRKDILIMDLDGKLLRTITRGTLFKVLPMEYSPWDFGKVQFPQWTRFTRL